MSLLRFDQFDWSLLLLRIGVLASTKALLFEEDFSSDPVSRWGCYFEVLLSYLECHNIH
jgi:hypothetical protein